MTSPTHIHTHAHIQLHTYVCTHAQSDRFIREACRDFSRYSLDLKDFAVWRLRALQQTKPQQTRLRQQQQQQQQQQHLGLHKQHQQHHEQHKQHQHQHQQQQQQWEHGHIKQQGHQSSHWAQVVPHRHHPEAAKESSTPLASSQPQEHHPEDARGSNTSFAFSQPQEQHPKDTKGISVPLASSQPQPCQSIAGGALDPAGPVPGIGGSDQPHVQQGVSAHPATSAPYSIFETSSASYATSHGDGGTMDSKACRPPGWMAPAQASGAADALGHGDGGSPGAKACRAPDWMVVGKHLCGAATDYALRGCLPSLPADGHAAPEADVVRRFRGLAIATCCHHR
eukprot:1160613-Pelagomonas_calceolata.AAC.8